MVKEISDEKFIVRIHGQINKENLISACKKYCEKVDLKKEGRNANEKDTD